ncbi:MAG: hypothetical protein Q8N03_12985 [Ignavibacteria bacterium]|nr:hypothetical protein [Ignavibacteria bacterium]MDP3829680.1 hypothetical protein [Ignavibacteriaceae bacterium]
MVKIILFSVLFLFGDTIIKSQNKININVGYGHYLTNSENSTKIMSDKKFQSYVLYDFSYLRENLFGINMMIEYSFQKITKKDIIQFIMYDPSPNPAPPPLWGDIQLINHNIDFDYSARINKYFSFGIGPSFIIVNRILEVDTVLYDKLASSGIGVNGFTEFSIPFNSGKNYFYFTSKLKFRYTHSIWFDKGIRDLENYNQEYFTVQLLVGIGYSF